MWPNSYRVRVSRVLKVFTLEVSKLAQTLTPTHWKNAQNGGISGILLIKANPLDYPHYFSFALVKSAFICIFRGYSTRAYPVV
jgi:hypothetical protein